MTTRTSAQSGLSSATTTWVGGVVPIVGDQVIIAAGHIVELNATHHWGNDTVTGIVVNGTLRASRTVSSQLTCRGDLFIDPTVGGTLDLGTEADPIPATTMVTVVVNESAAMAHGRWTIRTNQANTNWTGSVSIWGATKRMLSAVTAPFLSTDTTVFVDAVTGWLVGDIVGFTPVANTTPLYRRITAIVLGGATPAITLSASLGRAGAVGNGVINMTRNITLRGHLPTTWRSTALALRVGNGVTQHRLSLGPCTVVSGGNGGTGGNWLHAGINFLYESSSNRQIALRKLAGTVVTSLVDVVGATETYVENGVAPVGFCAFSGQAAPFYVEELCVMGRHNRGDGVRLFSGASVDFGENCLILGKDIAVHTQFSQGAVDSTWRGQIHGATNICAGVCISLSFLGARMGAVGRLASIAAAGSLTFRDVIFGAHGATTQPFLTPVVGTLAPTLLSNVLLPTGLQLNRVSGIDTAHPSHSITLLQRNGDPFFNERYTPGGRVHRDATRARRSTASICLASWFTANLLSMPVVTRVQPGATLRIRGAVWIEASYLPGDAPGIRLGATGLTTLTWAAPAVADTWHEFDLSIANTNSFPSDVTITLTARSNANTETARVWVDGLFADPWSGSVRHHGFQWLAQTALLPDTRITLTEAAALALPVAVDHVAQTITVTGAVTARQVFEAAMANLAQTAHQGRAVHLSSATGDSFETSYTVATSGTGAVAGAYTDATGRRVTISAPALVNGSRVQLFNLTTATELFNGVLPGTGLLLPATWTADHTIRLRAEHADKQALQTVGVMSNTGLTYLDVQADDTVYIGNAIDGATCTEFVADGVNLQIDISDPDGVTSVQRLYAWAQWYQTTAAGIASGFFGAVTALDSANYLIDQALANIQLDNVRPTPVRVVGGYLARKDGSTLIAPLSGSIQMDPGRAFLAGVDGLARESTAQTILALSLG